MSPMCELCCLKVYQSAGVEVHLVIACGYVNNDVCFESFDCEGANKCSNHDVMIVTAYIQVVNNMPQKCPGNH